MTETQPAQHCLPKYGLPTGLARPPPPSVGTTAEECLMRAWRGPAVKRGLGQMVYHYPFLLITAPRAAIGSQAQPGGRTKVPVILEGRNVPSFCAICLSSQLLWRPQTTLAQWGPRGARLSEERELPKVISGRTWGRDLHGDPRASPSCGQLKGH